MSEIKSERRELFDFKNTESQQVFRDLTTNTREFSKCFENDLPFENQASNFRKVLNKFFYRSFKKIRITNKPKRNKTYIGDLMKERTKLKKNQFLNVDDEDKLVNIECMISEACEDENRKKVFDNFKEVNGNNGNLSHQGVWKLKKNVFQKSNLLYQQERRT